MRGAFRHTVSQRNFRAEVPQRATQKVDEFLDSTVTGEETRVFTTS
jgi:hypothetical protein